MSRPIVLILGSSGFIGQAIQRELNAKYDLISVDLNPNAFNEASSIAHHIVDQGNPDQVERLLTALKPYAAQLAGVIHLTAYYDFRNKADKRYTQLEETFPQLLEGLDALLPAGRPILHSSSMAAMEPTEPGSPLLAVAPELEVGLTRNTSLEWNASSSLLTSIDQWQSWCSLVCIQTAQSWSPCTSRLSVFVGSIQKHCFYRVRPIVD